MTDPYVKSNPGDFIFSEDWNELQSKAREHIISHDHSGGEQGVKLAGGGIDPEAVVTLKDLNLTGNLQVRGKQTLAEIEDLLALLTQPGASGEAATGGGGLSRVIGQLAAILCVQEDQLRHKALLTAPVDGEGSLLYTSAGMLFNVIRLLYALFLEEVDLGEVGQIAPGVTLGDSGHVNLEAFLRAESYAAYYDQVKKRIREIDVNLRDWGSVVVVHAVAGVIGRRILAHGGLAPDEITEEAAVGKFMTMVEAYQEDFGATDAWNGVSARKAVLDRFFFPLAGSHKLDHAAVAGFRELLLEILAAVWRLVVRNLLVQSPPRFDFPPGIDKQWAGKIQPALHTYERAFRGDGLVRDLGDSIRDILIQPAGAGEPGAVWLVTVSGIRRMPLQPITAALEESNLDQGLLCPEPDLIIRGDTGWLIINDVRVEGEYLLLQIHAQISGPCYAIKILTRYFGSQTFLAGELFLTPSFSTVTGVQLFVSNKTEKITAPIPVDFYSAVVLGQTTEIVSSHFVRGVPSIPPLVCWIIKSPTTPSDYRLYNLDTGKFISVKNSSMPESARFEAYMVEAAGDGPAAQRRLALHFRTAGQGAPGNLHLSKIIPPPPEAAPEAESDPTADGTLFQWEAVYQFPWNFIVMGAAKGHLIINTASMWKWTALPVAALQPPDVTGAAPAGESTMIVVGANTETVQGAPPNYPVSFAAEMPFNPGSVMDSAVVRDSPLVVITSSTDRKDVKVYSFDGAFQPEPLKKLRMGAGGTCGQVAAHVVGRNEGWLTVLVASTLSGFVEFQLVEIAETP